MKSIESTESLLSDLKVQLRKGRRNYWKAHCKQEYDDAENISMANMAIVAKIEVVELILE